MKNLILSIAVLTCLLISYGISGDELSNPAAEPLKTEKDCIKIAQKAGNFVQEGKPESALDLFHQQRYCVRPYVPANQKNLLLTNFYAVIEGIAGELGTPIQDGFEYIGTRKIGNSVLHVYFWSKYQYGPVPWRISFYKPYEEWKFMDFTLGPDVVPDLSAFSLPVSNR